jgi:hypothetical protein
MEGEAGAALLDCLHCFFIRMAGSVAWRPSVSFFYKKRLSRAEFHRMGFSPMPNKPLAFAKTSSQA